MVVELDAIHLAALHDLTDQAETALAHAWVRWIQEHHRLAVQLDRAAAVPFLQHPLRVLLHHRRRGRLHQAVFKPGDHLQAAAVGLLAHAADRVVATTDLGQGWFDWCPAAVVKGAAAAPDVGIQRVESGCRQFGHGPVDATGGVVQRAGTVGQPDAEAPRRRHRLRGPDGSWSGEQGEAGRHQQRQGAPEPCAPGWGASQSSGRDGGGDG
jgi:hypothetical protein